MENEYPGSRFTNVFDGLKSDILEKGSRFIERSCELHQEFFLSHPEVKSNLNQIYNIFKKIYQNVHSFFKSNLNSLKSSKLYIYPCNVFIYIIQHFSTIPDV